MLLATGGRMTKARRGRRRAVVLLAGWAVFGAFATKPVQAAEPDLIFADDFEGGPCIQLTVKNFLAWCSVSIAGGPASAAAVQTACVAANSPVTLAAVALPFFQLGATPWHDTDGDTGAGDPGTRTGSGQDETATTTETTGTGDTCVWVCCEFVGGGGCPSTDQCP
jgi:hypothetical protein